MSHAFVRPLPFGATLLDDGRVRFRLWAPAQQRVAVEIEGASPVPMRQEPDGWFQTELPCRAGAGYRYRLQDGVAVPDPASRAQPSDVHGPSEVVDPASYSWRQTKWRGRPWREVVLYELHVGLCGGFSGVSQQLPRLADLGVTAIELMPINEFPGRRNWGYDGVLPFAPDSSYGAPDDLKRLVDRAHELGLMMFLDVVYNHFGPDGNNLAAYAPQFFRRDLKTPWGPAIDFRRPEVRRFFTENALYWLMEYRFDGLRFDAVHAISEADWLDEMATEVRNVVEPGRHVHLVLENDDNIASHLEKDFDAQWNDDAHHVLHVLLTGQTDGYYCDYADGTAERLARALAEGFVYQGEASRYRNGEPRGTPSARLPPSAFVLFLQNHDQIGNRAFGERITTLASPAAVEAAIALQLLCPQIPLLFMGEEDASQTPFLYFTDHNEQLAVAVREGRRREFASFPSFGDAKKRERIPDPNAESTFERSRPKPDPAQAEGRRALYRRLLTLRRTLIAPHLDGTRSLGATAAGGAGAIARWRLGNADVLTLATNLGRSHVGIARPSGDVLFETAPGAARRAQSGTLQAQTTVAFLERAP